MSQQPVTNPYMPSGLDQLAMMLMSLGGGMSAAGQANQPWFAGIGPGAAMFGQSLAAARRHAIDQQQQDELRRLRERQFGLQEAEFQDKRDERTRQREAAMGWTPPGAGSSSSSPGMGVPAQPPRMGPQSYDTRLAGYEGGSKNGGMIYNELGSGAYGPYQFMPGTWADVRANNPDLNLPEDIRQATREQHDAAHGRFREGNAQALRSAGIEPTPANLYLAHRFGAGGATTLLRAPDDSLLANVLPAEWQRQNPDMRGQTVAGFKRLATERMAGVGAPYTASGERTEYQFAPNALPAFGGPGAPSIQPRANANPDFTLRVTPVGGASAAPQPPQATATSPAPGAPPSSASTLPPPPQVSRPALPAEDDARLRRAVRSGQMTIPQAEAEASRIVTDLWNRQQSHADEAYRQQVENLRFERGQRAEQSRFDRDQAEKTRTREEARTQAETKRGDEQSKFKIEDENKLRDDFDKSPVVRSYRTVVPMLESAKDAADRPTRAADLNLIYAFAKLMDPESVVRESETGMVTATGTVSDRLAGLVGQLNGGQMLQPETRQRLIAELQSRFDTLKSSYDAHEEAYKGIAERRGLDFNNIRVPIRSAGSPAGGRAPAGDYAAGAPTNEELRQKVMGQTKPIRIDLSGKRQ